MAKLKTSQTEEMELPFLALDPAQAANRVDMRSIAKRGRETYLIPYPNLMVVDHLNTRIRPVGMTDDQWFDKLQIKQFAEYILNGGIIPPLKGDLIKVGKKIMFRITGGHRRFLAIGYLLSQGHKKYPDGRPINMVEVLPNPKEWTEGERFFYSGMADNLNLDLTPMETALSIWRMKNQFKYTNDQIAKMKGVSRQWVDNQVSLAEEPETIQMAIESGTITTTAALALKQKEKDPAKREKMVKDATDKGEKIKVADVKPEKEIAPVDIVETTGCCACGIPLLSPAEVSAGLCFECLDKEDQEEEFIPGGFNTIETKKSIQQEQEARSTSSKTPVSKPNRKNEDALIDIDFKKDKEEGEMELNELSGLLDKAITKIGQFPDHLQQYKDDIIGLLHIGHKKIEAVTNILKKASDTR